MVFPEGISVIIASSGKSMSCRTTNSKNSRIPKSTGRGRRLPQGLFGFFNQAAHRVRGLGPTRHPVIDSVKFKSAVLTRFLWIICSDKLKEFSVARAAAVSHHHFVIRAVERAFSAESN